MHSWKRNTFAACASENANARDVGDRAPGLAVSTEIMILYLQFLSNYVYVLIYVCILYTDNRRSGAALSKFVKRASFESARSRVLGSIYAATQRKTVVPEVCGGFARFSLNNCPCK